VVCISAAPHSQSHSEESHEVHDDNYKVDDDRFHGADQLFHHQVSDSYAENFQSHHQYVQDDGTIVGEYAILAPDGETLQIVKYTAGAGGYNADVRYTDDLSVF